MLSLINVIHRRVNAGEGNAGPGNGGSEGTINITLTLQSTVLLDYGNRSSTSQKIPRNLYNPKVHYRKNDVWLTVHRNSVWIRKTN